MRKELRSKLNYWKILAMALGFLFLAMTIIYYVRSQTDRQLLPTETEKVTLFVGGYGYSLGDIVQIEIRKPELGDIVVYSPSKNKSSCFAFGPDMALGKVVGTPGETFFFQNSTFKIRDLIIKLDRDYSQQGAIFAGEKYKNLFSKNIILKSSEYLLDKWVGLECFPGEIDETGSSVAYNRFTVNEEALIGIITNKIGHDDEAEKNIKKIIY